MVLKITYRDTSLTSSKIANRAGNKKFKDSYHKQQNFYLQNIIT
uniref:Uncharacterized protein n=1 Tax=Rhizophora mucronata TaxID=61149 RepID=A0A2P2P733_RHIMU